MAAILPMCVALVVVLAGCMSDPPPPVRETAPPATPTEYPTEKTLRIATDSIGGGFNPHIASDQSLVTTAIAAMTLPSAFTPVQTPTGVEWQREDAFVTSAEVTSQSPFTVTYKIHNDAQWSDGLPVTGDDFSYLWQQMSRQPNVVAPAGYRLIDAVASKAGGKEVEVRFAQPYPAWRELFTGLLPSHVLRGAPAGFQTGMDSGKPVSAGPFSVVSIDPTRDEVRLVRNDRYWKKPPSIDQVVLRRAGTASQMVESVRTGDSALANVSTGPATTAELTSIPGLQSQRSLTARSLGVNVNARTEVMRSPQLRQAVLGMIDARLVTFSGAGDDVVEPFANTVFAPSDPGYFPVDRQRPGPADVAALMDTAGYRRGEATASSTPSESAGPDSPGSSTPSAVPSAGQSGSPSSAATTTTPTPEPTTVDGTEVKPLPAGVAPYQKDGKDLVVRVGAVSGDPRASAAAANVADQLRGQGVRAVVVTLPNNELYGSALTSSRVDLIVGWTGLGVPPAASLASQVDCDQPKPGTAPSVATPPTPTSTAPGQTQATTDDSYISNISGICDQQLITLARQALSEPDPIPTLTSAEPLLAEQAVYMPLYQDSALVGLTDGVRNVGLSGPIQVGIYGNSVAWELP